ncbi:ABC transporter substrate-binding protein [Pseudomonas sp. DSP3-2-2]|uniref:ABC transporter substrate-binding protein n=1 Tax=unclassified Pseudomonas TaxID=196821 RepID=UPI003CEF83C2
MKSSVKKALACGLVAMLGAGVVQAQPLRLALNSDVRGLDPGVNRDDRTDQVVLHMVEGLVAYGEKGEVKPLLAEKVDVSADGLSYTFTLRRGVTFHNGDTLTSADVLWSWKRDMDPKTQWRCLSEFDGSGLTKVIDIQAPDEHTVVMRLEKPSGMFLATLARTDCGGTGVLSKASLNAQGEFVKPVGTGPYRLGEWKRGQYVSLTKFANYQSLPGPRDGYTGGKQALADEVRFVIIPDQATVKAALFSGDLDMAEVTETDLPEIKSHANLKVSTSPSATMNVLMFQTRDPLLKDKRIRQAIAAAIDVNQLVATTSNGFGVANNSIVSVASSYYGAAEKAGFSYDPQKAAALLQQAGYHGQPLTIVANRRSMVPSYDLAIITQAMLQAVGMNVQVEVLEWGTQLERYQTGRYQAMSFTYSARFDPALSFEQVTGNKDKEPRKGWEDPVAIDLLAQSLKEGDVSKRQALFDQLHERFIDQVPMIVMYNGLDIMALNQKVEGYNSWIGQKPRLWGVSVKP